MMPKTLIRLLVPVPPMLEQAFGYDGSADYVAFYWSEVGDELAFNDSHGLSSVGGRWDAWQTFVQSPAIQRYLEPFDFGSSDSTAKQWLLLDRKNRLFYVADAYHVNAYLVAQQIPGVNVIHEMTPAELDLVAKQLAELNAAIDRWDDNVSLKKDAIVKYMEQEHTVVTDLRRWLLGLESARGQPMTTDRAQENKHYVISDKNGMFYSKGGSPDNWTYNEELSEKYLDKNEAYSVCDILKQFDRDCFVL